MKTHLVGRRPRRLLAALAATAAVAVGATGCGTHIEGDLGTPPTVLTVSDTWVSNHQDADPGSGGAAGGSSVASRVGALTDAVTALRTETGTGWTGRQDDLTGYLTDLRGGAWGGDPAAFMDAYGPRLFGVDSGALSLGAPDTVTVPNVVTTRATQVLGQVPVLDGTLVFSGRGTPEDGSERVTGVRGRVFPDLTVSTTPTLTAEQADATAAQLSGGVTDGDPRLVVLPTGAGVLAWEVVVVSGTGGVGEPGTPQIKSGFYYIDATTGVLAQLRPASAELSAPVPGLHATRAQQAAAKAFVRETSAAPDANSVQLSGTDTAGRPLTAYGVKNGKKIDFVDTTTQAYDAGNGTGTVTTHDASAVRNDSQLPGPVATTRGNQVSDSELLSAQAFSHDIADFYESLGRNSWDDAGGDLISSVHYGSDDFCNAFFSSSLRQPQMVYGNPCHINGQQVSDSLVEPDIAAHEITHGVTATSAGLLYSGQSGALNESFSDYFGNVIGDIIHGRDSVAIGEDNCRDYPQSNGWCSSNPDGTSSVRYMLNGDTFDDYLRILDPGVRLQVLLGYNQDSGGVHENSAIWNNALWSIRTQLAKIDNQPALTSPLAKSFDKAVYGALTTRLTPTAGFVDARNAVEQVIGDSGLDPVVLRVAREVFDANKICTGCPDTAGLAGDPVNTSPQTQEHPTISGDQVAWLDLSTHDDYAGYGATTTLGGSGAVHLTPDGSAYSVAFGGDALIALEYDGTIARYAADGSSTALDQVDVNQALAAGLAGSDAGGAWLSDNNTISYVTPDGQVTSQRVQGLGGDTVISIGTGGGTVAVGTDGGQVLLWTPGQGGFAPVGRMSSAVLDVAAYGGTVLGVDDSSEAVLFSGGQTLQVSSQAAFFGAAVSSEYAVWAEAVGPAQSATAGGQTGWPDTDLYLVSLKTGKIYDLIDSPAQQGFPAISGRQLVWQDAALGGDDIFTATIPGGL